MTTTSRISHPAARRLAPFLLPLLAAPLARAASIQTIDGKTVTGEIQSLTAGDFVVQPPKPDNSPSTPWPPIVKVPWQDVIQFSLSWQDRIDATPGPTVAATHPSTPEGLLWQVEMGETQRVRARMTAWSETTFSLSVSSLDEANLVIPVPQLRALWAVPESRPDTPKIVDLLEKARKLAITAPGRDVAYVETSGDVKAVAGVALGFDGDFLKFKYEDQERKIKLERIVGLVLAPHDIPEDKSRYETFTLSSGEIISAHFESLILGTVDEKKTLKVITVRCHPLAYGSATENTSTLDIPLNKIDKVAVHNGRLVWLGDLRPSAVEQVPYFDRLIPYRVNEGLNGGPAQDTKEKLTFSDEPHSFEHGIAVHAKCHLAYDLAGSFDRFRVTVGFQYPEGKIGRAALRILADEKVLWENPDMKGTDQPVPLDLNVAGVKTLRLEADFGKEQDVGDDIVWGEARLLKPALKK